MKKRNTIKYVLLATLILSVFLLPLHPVSAQYRNQEKIPGAQQTDKFIQYLKDIINFGFAVIGILALFMLVIGAYQYLIAAGTGNVAGAKETIASALLGLILGLCAYIILYKINPDLVEMREITQITGTTSSTLSRTDISLAYSGDAIAISGTTKEKIAAYQSVIYTASQANGVDESVIKAVIDVESGGDPYAKNPDSSASGLMQLTKAAARDAGVTNVFDGSDNINGGTKYLASMIQKTGSVENGVAAYYTGLGNFQKAGGWQNCSADTKAYVNKVMGKTQSYSKG
jgi:hypothetical protein